MLVERTSKQNFSLSQHELTRVEFSKSRLADLFHDTMWPVALENLTGLSVREYQLLEVMESEKLFSYVKIDIGNLEYFRPPVAKFPPRFKLSLVVSKVIGKLLRRYAEDGGLMSQLQNWSIWSLGCYKLEHFLNPRLMFISEISLFRRKQTTVPLSTLRKSAWSVWHKKL